MNRGERVALRHYRLRGYRLLAANARVGRYELDLVLRRGGRVLVVEVKEKAGATFGHPLEMIDDEKVRRVRTAAARLPFSAYNRINCLYTASCKGSCSSIRWAYPIAIS